MKKFINEHPKLYFAILLLIAGLVFGIVTGIGCAKIRKAEASSDVITSDVVLNLYNRYLSEYGSDSLSDKPYYLFVYDKNSNNIKFIPTSDSCTLKQDSISGVTRLVHASTDLCVYSLSQSKYTCLAESFTRFYPDGESGIYFANYMPTTTESVYSFYANYQVAPISNAYLSNSYLAPVINDPVYLVNAPYLEYQSVESQSNYVNDKIHPIDEGFHIVNYKVAGQPMTPPDGYKVLYEYCVYLPTKDYFYQYLRDDLLIDLDGLNTMQSNIAKWRRNSVGSSDSKLWVFNLDRNIEAEKTNGDAVRIRLDYGDVLTELEEFNSVSLKEYYGFDNDTWGAYGKYIMAHLVVYRVDCIVYTLNTPDIYYGRNVTVHFPPYLEKPIVTEYNGDYFNPDYDYDKEVDAKIDQALKDAKEEADKLLEEYKGMINNQENMFGSFDSEFADVGLWGALRGIGSGFLGLTGFITNFAVLVGGIFSFVPIAFQQYVGYTLLAILLIGLWKTIKG